MIPIYLNVTELQTRAYIGGLLLAGLGKSVSWDENPNQQSSLSPASSSLTSLTSPPSLIFFSFSSESSESSGGKYLSFTTSSVLEWFRSLNFVSYTNILPGYYVTFPANKDKRAYLNDTSGAFPLLYTLAGAGLVAYVSKWPPAACMLRVALLVSDIFTTGSPVVSVTALSLSWKGPLLHWLLPGRSRPFQWIILLTLHFPQVATSSHRSPSLTASDAPQTTMTISATVVLMMSLATNTTFQQ